MKVSEITVTDVAKYIHEDDEDSALGIVPMLEAAKHYVKEYTGLTEEEIDEHEDFYIVIMVLCQDMYDNRCMYVDKSNVNKVVSTILNMHCVNLL